MATALPTLSTLTRELSVELAPAAWLPAAVEALETFRSVDNPASSVDTGISWPDAPKTLARQAI